jgi:hypothetical protein
MITNQMMTVQIGSFGTLEIGHLDKIGNVAKVIDIGNINRLAKGLEPILLDRILEKQDIWEFIIARNNQILRESKSRYSREIKKLDNFDVLQSDYSELLPYKTSSGHIRYGELMTRFPNLIKSKRGKNGGTWAEIYILLKIASMLDKDLEVEIYRIFINHKLLFWRDVGGDNFKEFNAMIDTLPDRIGKNNIKLYIEMAQILREKLNIENTKGYNEKEHFSIIQVNRAKLLDRLTSMIEVGLITSYSKLKEIILKIKLHHQI